MALTVRKSTQLEDPGADLLASATDLWDRYGRIAAIVAGVGVAVGAVFFMTLRSRAAAEEQAAGRLAEANVLYWQGEYSRSLQLSKQVSQQYPNAPSGIDAHRLAGDNAYWDGDFKTAITEYRAYLEKEKKGVLSDGVRRSLAYALESDGKFQEAATGYEALVGRFDRESSAELLEDSARCFRQLNQPAEAIKRLQRLLDEFGETSFAEPARIELAELSSAAP